MLEKHHKVRILEEAVEDSVRLSARYITDRQLPDKGVSLLDTACARVALSQSAKPPALEDVERVIQHTDTEIGILEREKAVGVAHDKRLEELRQRKGEAESTLAKLQKQWEEERKLVDQIREIRTKLEAAAGTVPKGERTTVTLTTSEGDALKTQLN